MIRNTLSILAGLITAVAVIMLIQSIGHSLYSPPLGLDFNDPAQLAAYIDTLPLAAFLFVLLAWLGGTFAGSVTAILLAQTRACIYALIIGATVLLAATGNMLMIPHPLWFMLAAWVLIPAAAYLACVITKKHKQPAIQDKQQ